MGLRFRKSIKLGKHFSVNLSPQGIGYSYGVKGARHSVSADGRHRTTYSVPGTGFSYTTSSSGRNRSPAPPNPTPDPPKSSKRSSGFSALLILFIAITVIAAACSRMDDYTAESPSLPEAEASDKSFPPPDTKAESPETEPAVQLPVVTPPSLEWKDDSTLIVPEGDTGTVSLRISSDIDPNNVTLSDVDPSVLLVSSKVTSDYIHYSYQAVSPGVANLSASCSSPELSSTTLQIIVEEKVETAEASVQGVLVPAEPEQTTIYYLNTSTKKIHRAGCSSVSKINDENKSTTYDYQSYLSSGYTWCGICH